MKKKQKVFNRFMKRDDARIYVLGYKPAPMPDNSLYTPLEVGYALHSRHFAQSDATGDNISALNAAYCELTGTYWIWKNRPTTLKWVGQCQYSKLIKLPQDTDFERIFAEYNAISVPWSCVDDDNNPKSLRRQFCGWHPQEWLDNVEDIIKTDYPEYAEAWDKYINNPEENTIYASAGYILKAEDYDRWCELIFGICDKFLQRYGGTVESMHKIFFEKLQSGEYFNRFIGREGFYFGLVFGFLAERIFTMWIRNLGKIMNLKYEYSQRV